MTSLSFWRLATNVDHAPSGPKKKVIIGEFAITLAQNDDHEERSYMRDHLEKGETTTFPVRHFLSLKASYTTCTKPFLDPMAFCPLRRGVLATTNEYWNLLSCIISMQIKLNPGTGGEHRTQTRGHR
ncbi:hypothetical protein FVEG_16218 [Fusarium verticillioides 7600]|uniref:Uncharacterized protein n=1 Tax=Gibberella moniliformis (strain M3125 / FGSC 7600) TaxID=334819 RepID=W7MJP2_GIBM7|nr:hypothetical protein FVEG_16218 [Fusarium verticillioides 7600]EWG47954.1 hypothetical protein FVEG_16218 [Fusarium verticillioides 7600]